MKRNQFEDAVRAIASISGCYRGSLAALGKNADKISTNDNKLLCGSVDLDECTKSFFPDSNRWDYIICHSNQILFVEVHDATSHGVTKVLAKLNWLKDWLRNYGKGLNEISKHCDHPYYWLSTGKILIPKRSSHFRRAEKAKLIPMKSLSLSGHKK